MKSQTLKGYSYILFSILVWSGWVVVSRQAMSGPLSAYDITAIRFTIAGLILLPVAFKKGLRIGPWGIWGAVVMACCIGAPYTNLSVLGMKYAPASHASTILNGALLVSTTTLGILLLKETTSPLRLVGVLVSIGGMGCMLMAKSAYGAGDNEWVGHVLFITAGIMWSGYTLFVKAWKADALQAAAAVCVFSMLLYMPPYLMFMESHITLANWKPVLFQSFYQGVLTAVIALISFNAGIRLLGASRATAFIPLVPVLSTLLAVPVLGEIPSSLEISGVAAVSLGVLLSSGVIRLRRSAAVIKAEEPTCPAAT